MDGGSHSLLHNLTILWLSGARRPQRLFDRGQSYYKAGDFKVAVDDLRSAVNNWPENDAFKRALKIARKALQSST